MSVYRRRKLNQCDHGLLSVARGVAFPPLDQLTTDGYDLQFGTNVLGMHLQLYSKQR